MTIAKDQLPQSQPETAPKVVPDPTSAFPPDIVFPPSDIYSDEPPLETELHLRQLILLLSCLDWHWRNRNDYFAVGNLTIYYSPKQRKSEDFRGPDFFVVLDTERKSRKSWVVWEEEGKYPNVIIEVLSDSTAETDRGLKKQIYQDTFRTPEYFWFDPNSLEFAGFALVQGEYQPMQLNERGQFWSLQLQLFLGIEDRQLRFFTSEGEMVPTPEEAALTEQQRAAKAEQRAAIEAEQRTAAEQRATEAEALLAQYRERFGELG
ncbi:MAG: Uma2 family endonuclease [Elainella sp.]